MSITDELRKFAWKECPSKFLERVIGIADDIDHEHESLLSDKEEELVLMDGNLDRLSGTIAELCSALGVDVGTKRDSQIRSELVEAARNTIPLPKDADCVLIHIGDELEWLDGNRLTVNGIGEGGTLFYVDVQGDVQWTASGDKRHVQHDSWEAIIEEAASYGDKRWFSGTQGDKAIIAELVERCKRLAGEDA